MTENVYGILEILQKIEIQQQTRLSNKFTCETNDIGENRAFEKCVFSSKNLQFHVLCIQFCLNSMHNPLLVTLYVYTKEMYAAARSSLDEYRVDKNWIMQTV